MSVNLGGVDVQREKLVIRMMLLSVEVCVHSALKIFRFDFLKILTVFSFKFKFSYQVQGY